MFEKHLFDTKDSSANDWIDWNPYYSCGMKKIVQHFFRSESLSGWLLLACIGVALIIANSAAANVYANLLTTEIGGIIAGVNLRYTLQSWINDGLMALFFLLVGLEVKRAFVIGALSSFQKASVPIFAAIGGCVVPALYFFFINVHTETAKGWAIPMATDIAFALAVLSIATRNRAGAIKTFLSTLAIADDICAIVVIAIFYSSSIHTNYLLAATGVFAFQIILNRAGVKSLWPYLLTGLLLWYLVHHSGIHATIAGVLTAFSIPLRSKNGSPLEKLEHALLTPVNFVIVPLFVLANTNITFSTAMWQGVLNPLSLGIYAGLLLGKPLGIIATSFLTVKCRIGVLPEGIKWPHIFGIGIVAGIGFTMSVFVTLLSFELPALQEQAKLAILLASTTAGLIGYFFFKQLLKAPKVLK